jgi:hypothetical protein
MAARRHSTLATAARVFSEIASNRKSFYRGGVGRGRGLGRDLGVTLGVAVGVGVTVAVGVAVGVTLGLTVAVGVTVGVGVGGWHGPVALPSRGTGTHAVMLTVSTRQPSPEPLVSLAIRQRSRAWAPNKGMLTTVVTNPPELPLQA